MKTALQLPGYSGRVRAAFAPCVSTATGATFRAGLINCLAPSGRPSPARFAPNSPPPNGARQRLREDERILQTVPPYPSSTLQGNGPNPEGTVDPGKQSRHDAELDLYASSILETEDYLDWGASDWGTFRYFVAPHGTSPDAIYNFLISHVPSGWQPKEGGAATASYTRGQRCLWFIVFRSDALQGRFDIAVDRRGHDPSC